MSDIWSAAAAAALLVGVWVTVGAAAGPGGPRTLWGTAPVAQGHPVHTLAAPRRDGAEMTVVGPLRPRPMPGAPLPAVPIDGASAPRRWRSPAAVGATALGLPAVLIAAILGAWRALTAHRTSTAAYRLVAVAGDVAPARKPKPIPPGTPRERYPAKELCSRCGLCDTPLIAHVQEACAFLGDGMARAELLEAAVHGRGRRADERHYGVAEEMLYARNQDPSWDTAPQPEGYASARGAAQWTGIVTQVAVAMLEAGEVDAVVCVQSDPDDRLAPRPFLARTVDDIVRAKGVKPSYSPNLSTLALLEALPDIRRLLFIGVGCQVQAVRSVEARLGLERLYVVGTNCADNGPREGLEKFLTVASRSPGTVLGYEFMQDYQVHFKHLPGSPIPGDYETVPYFSLPSNHLAHGVIGEPCRSCFDYTNSLADLVVGYMGVPNHEVPMSKHPQYVTVRNDRGRRMLDLIRPRLAVLPVASAGDRRPFVLSTLAADDAAFFGRAPPRPPPAFIANLLPRLLQWLGPKGLEFGRYSIDYHTLRNWLYTVRVMGRARAERHTPSYAKAIVAEYNADGALDRMLVPQENRHAFDVPGAIPHPPGWTGGLRYDTKGFVLPDGS